MTTYVKKHFEDNDLDFNLYLNDLDFRGGIQPPSGAKRSADRLRRLIIPRPPGRNGTSTEAYVSFFAGAPISWYSKKQSTNAPSSTVAKYCVYDAAVKEGIWVRELLRFDIDNPEDVRQELERLEDLAAEHHGLNMNERFITRFKCLQNQQDQLKTNNNSVDDMDCDTNSSGSFIDADSFFDASEQLEPESPPRNDQWKGKGKAKTGLPYPNDVAGCQCRNEDSHR